MNDDKTIRVGRDGEAASETSRVVDAPPPAREVELVIGGRTERRLRDDAELDAAITAALDAEERN